MEGEIMDGQGTVTRNRGSLRENLGYVIRFTVLRFEFFMFFLSSEGRSWITYLGLREERWERDGLEPLVHLLVEEHLKIPYILAWVNHRGFHIDGNAAKTRRPIRFFGLYKKVRMREPVSLAQIEGELRKILSAMRAEASKLHRS